VSEFLNPLQLAVYNRLVAQLPTINIYDDSPGQPDGKPAVNFPYIVLGDDTGVPWDTDDVLGTEATITLHVWSRYRGKKECKTLLGLIYTALHRQAANLSATGYTFVDCLFEFSTVMDQNDGITRHGVCRYRLLIEKE
jgi:hypothetical protein